MASNFPGPYQVRIFYSVPLSGGGSRNHIHRLNLDFSAAGGPGDPFADFEVARADGSSTNLNTIINGYLDDIAEFFVVGASFYAAEIWEYEPGTNDATFRTAASYAVAGAIAGATVNDSQIIATFRTAGGGTMRLELLDTIVPPQLPDRPPLSITGASDWLNVFATGSGWALGRDNSYPIALLGLYPGLNSRLEQDRLRP